MPSATEHVETPRAFKVNRPDYWRNHDATTFTWQKFWSWMGYMLLFNPWIFYVLWKVIK